MSGKTIEIGFKKVGITLLFSLFSVFHQFFGRWGAFSFYNPLYGTVDQEWQDISQEYEKRIRNLDIQACVESGKLYQVCETQIPAL
jgi:hypothetical protein